MGTDFSTRWMTGWRFYLVSGPVIFAILPVLFVSLLHAVADLWFNLNWWFLWLLWVVALALVVVTVRRTLGHIRRPSRIPAA